MDRGQGGRKQGVAVDQAEVGRQPSLVRGSEEEVFLEQPEC